jgi:hypothetical protein
MDHAPPIAKLPSRHSTAAELAALAWSESLRFCHLKYRGDGCNEPCDTCYQTALNRLMFDARRSQTNASVKIRR